MNLNVLCAVLKLLYYTVLILYHGLDFVMDWYSFHIELSDETISGVPANSIAVKVLFGFSCVCCTICTAALLRVYAYYIKYHYLCLYVAAFEDYGPVGPVEGSASIQISDDELRENASLFIENGRKAVDPKYPLAELVISVAELTLKDDIQSGLLFWVSTAYTFTRQLSWHSLLFAICSLLAHLKLFICFVTKLFRLGEGENVCGDRSRWDFKCCLCVFGCIGSATFEGLTIAYLVKALQA
jgi:hypothetical protein